MPNTLQCRIEDTHSLQLTVPSPGVSAGDMGLLEDTIYFWLDDYATGELGVKIIEAEHCTVKAASAAVFAVGDYVYYDDTLGELNTTAAGRYRCGICRVAKAALELTAQIDFWGHDAVAV